MLLCGLPFYGIAHSDTATTRACSNSHCDCGTRNPLPAGVTTGHLHEKGQWMLSYYYMGMYMQGNQTGSTAQSDMAIADRYMMVPTRMTMNMHMVMAMYGLTNRLTLMAMGSYNTANMDMWMPGMHMANMPDMPDMKMNSNSSGLGDTRLYALYGLNQNSDNRFIGSIGVQLPTGSVGSKGTTMLGAKERLPYNMQPGSGNFALLPAITWVRTGARAHCGAEVGADIKLNDNRYHYRWGNSWHLTAWAGYRPVTRLNVTLRAELAGAQRISGADPSMLNEIMQTYDLTASAGNYGGVKVNAYGGFSYSIPALLGDRCTAIAELGIPVYQNLNGTQMTTTHTLTAGVQYGF